VNEPVSLAEARDQVEIMATDTTQDIKLIRFIKSAREQVEHDTGRALINQTFTLKMPSFGSESYFRLQIQPVASITSITYYDSSNAQQTLATSVYGLDPVKSIVHLKYNQSWPSITEQHNGIVTTFVAGFGATEAYVPRIYKQAIMLQVTKWFVHRGDEGQVHGAGTYDEAYDRTHEREDVA
jgi:uncharacterized phiE125 gp8 family phage protein